MADVARIFHDKPKSHSAVAQTQEFVTLLKEKAVQAQINAENARLPRKKEVTQAEVLAVKSGYIAQYDTERGWIEYTARALSVNRNTITSRVRKKK